MAKPGISAPIRRMIFEQAGACCEYCRNQQRYSTAPFSVEHIVPVSGGGSNNPENLACACPACNAHKFTKTHAFDSLTRQTVPLFNPRAQVWEEHFTWDETFTQILGTSPSGRATAKALNMNRKESINLRSLLVAFGKHPPKTH